MIFLFFKIIKRFYVLIFREWEREAERADEKYRLVASCTSYDQGPSPKPRYVP